MPADLRRTGDYSPRLATTRPGWQLFARLVDRLLVRTNNSPAARLFVAQANYLAGRPTIRRTGGLFVRLRDYSSTICRSEGYFVNMANQLSGQVNSPPTGQSFVRPDSYSPASVR